MEFRYIISNKWTNAEIRLILDALEFVSDFYELNKGVTTVKLINDDPLDATAERLKNNRFEIRLTRSKLVSNTEILKALFHEMTHVKQYLYDNLRLSGHTAKWQTKSFKNFDYWLAPWEMEARAMEDALVHLFLQEY
jgi:hypothetical protein